MPIYDYRCDHCGHAFSAVQSFKEEALTACPSCGKSPRRLLSKPAIVFKGSGWYITDSRGAGSAASSPDSGGPSDKTDKKDAPKSAGTTSGTTEKPATS